MTCRLFLLALGLVTALALPAPAGIFFGKRAKPNPAERVPQLLILVKTDADEDKRVSAAKELREFDPNAFPEMVPILIDVLKHDQQAAVRAETAQTLGKLRPISPQAGMALEEAAGDSSWRVRWQVRQSLLGYRIGGYRSPPKPEETAPPAPSAGKPGANRVPPAPAVKRGLLSPVPKTGPTVVPNETPPPPLAEPPSATPAPGPVPKGSSSPVPTGMPKLQKLPPKPSDEGPDLPLGD
jgi:hypothetical protein